MERLKAFSFSLGPTGSVANLNVIELRSKPKINSVIQSAESQIYDEYSFPIKGHVKFKDGQTAQYEFTKITFNETFDLPKANIPKDALRVEWDFNSTSSFDEAKAAPPRNLKFEKTLKHEMGMVLNYYRNGAQFLSVIRYKNLGKPPAKKGISVRIAGDNGSLLPGPTSNALIISKGDTTYVYSSNLLIDDLIEFAQRQ